MRNTAMFYPKNYKEQISDDLVLKAQNGDQQAINEIIIKLTPYLKQYIGNFLYFSNIDIEKFQMTKDDLLSEAILFIYDQIKRYKPNKGITFSFYVFRYVYHKFFSMLFSHKNEAVIDFSSIASFKQNREKDEPDSVTDNYIDNNMSESAKTFFSAFKKESLLRNIEQKEAYSSLLNIISNLKKVKKHHIIIFKIKYGLPITDEDIYSLKKTSLPPKYQELLEYLEKRIKENNNTSSLTFEEVANIFNVSKQRIQQIERKIFNSVKKAILFQS